MNTKKYCLVLNEELMKQIKKYAIDTNETLSNVVNMFLEKALSSIDK